MDTDDFNKLYLISYLVSETEEESVVGYSNLAARLLFLKNLIENEERLERTFIREIRDLVVVDEDDSLDWAGLKDLIERAKSDDYGQMFLEVSSNSVGPEKWTYEFHCAAPPQVMRNKLENLLGSENKTRFLEKVDRAAKADDEDLLEHVYQS